MDENIYVRSYDAKRKIMYVKDLNHPKINKPNIHQKSNPRKIKLYKHAQKKINQYDNSKIIHCDKVKYNNCEISRENNIKSYENSAESYENNVESYDNESFNVTSITTPTCVDFYIDDNSSFGGQNNISKVGEKNLYLHKNISTINIESMQNNAKSSNYLCQENFIIYLRKLVIALKAFIILLSKPNKDTDMIIIEHEKLINLYDFDTEIFNFDTQITISFVMALKTYGKYIAEIESYDNIKNIINNLNKISCNQNDILNIVSLYQSKYKVN